MDVGFYLGELLMQVGEVSVPGLGYFVQARMSGYYDEQDGTFYPPYHQVQFDVQSIDDDALAQYIADKKNISLASARYFCEKYITNLKQQAVVGEISIGNLGWFYTDQGQLTFRPADKLIDDTIFYGYQAIKMGKATSAPEPEPEKPVITRPDLIYPTRYPKQEAAPEPEPEPENEHEAVYETGATETESGSTETENQYGYDEEFLNTEDYYEEEERRGPMRTIIIVVGVVLVLVVGIFALKTYAPDAFQRLQFWKQKGVTVPLPVDKDSTLTTPADTLKTDSTTTVDSIVKDSTAKVVAKGDTTIRYELIVATCKNIGDANKKINEFKKVGLDVKIVTDAPGPRIKLSAGVYKTEAEAASAATALTDAKKSKVADTYPQPIKTVQQ